MYYTPVKLSCSTKKAAANHSGAKDDKENKLYYKKGILYTVIKETVEEAPSNENIDPDFFLSLLKNNTTDGKYTVSAAYTPNGKEVIYTNLYGKECKPASLLVNGEKMLYELLEISPNTSSMVDRMKEIMHEYKSENYTVTDSNSDIYEDDGYEGAA